MLPSSVLETCYGCRLETLNGYAFIELTYKLLVFQQAFIITYRKVMVETLIYLFNNFSHQDLDQEK